MKKYALYEYNYDYLDSMHSPEYERSGQRVLIELYDDKEKAVKEQLERERYTDIQFYDRLEWYELTQNEIEALKEILGQQDIDSAFSINDDNALVLDPYEIHVDKLNDNQLLKISNLIGGQYEVEEYIEKIIQTVLYTNAGGYVKKDPNGYSDDYIQCHYFDFDELIMLVDEYNMCWGETLIDTTTDLTSADLANSEFWSLVEEYADKVKVDFNKDKTSGLLSSISNSNMDYQCLYRFSLVLDNPFFVIHGVTDTEIVHINENPNVLLEKYKHHKFTL